MVPAVDEALNPYTRISMAVVAPLTESVTDPAHPVLLGVNADIALKPSALVATSPPPV